MTLSRTIPLLVAASLLLRANSHADADTDVTTRASNTNTSPGTSSTNNTNANTNTKSSGNASGGVKVTGRIRESQVCSLQAIGEVKYNRHVTSLLNWDKPTQLATRLMKLKLSCPGGGKLGVSFVDGYARTRANGLKAGNVIADFGLAPSPQVYRMGALAVRISNSMSSTVRLREIVLAQEKWREIDSSGSVMAGTIIGWRRAEDAPTSGPGTFPEITADLQVTPVIIGRNRLMNAESIHVEGLVTSELHYL